MEFIDLKRQQKRIREDIDKRISNILNHGKYLNGPEINELEERLANFCNVPHAVAVSSGTDALLMSLMAHNIGQGDAVITTPFTFISTAETIKLLGALPVFADIKKDTYNIDVNEIKKAIIFCKKNNINVKAIIPVDIFGQSADYDEIEAIAKEENLILIEDAAQSFGATYKDKRCGSFGDIAITSFFPAKPLGCYGDGGMLFCHNQEIYEKLISIRVHGFGKKGYNHQRLGLTARMDTMQAAIILAKMEIFEEEIEMRESKAANYIELFNAYCTVPFIKNHNKSVWAQFTLCHPKRDNIISALKEEKIPCAIYYSNPLHLHDVFKDLAYKKGDFQVSEYVSTQIFAIPFHPYLKIEEQEYIANVIIKAINN